MPSALDFIVSMILIFFVFAVLVSAFTEIWNTAREKRARCLWAGVARMLGSEGPGGQLVDDLKRHPALRALASGQNAQASYLPSQLFAAALVDVLMVKNASQAQSGLYGVGDAIALFPETDRAGMVLRFLWRRAGADPALFQQQIASYFDQLMDRVSGWYKRGSSRRCFLVGLLCAAAFNVDAVHLGRALWNNPHLAQQYANNGERILVAYAPDAHGTQAAGAGTVVKAGLSLDLPIGWPAKWFQTLREEKREIPLSEYIWTLAGFIIMAFACLVGAPLWFQLLGALLPLRLNGPVPGRASTPPESPGSLEKGGAPAAANDIADLNYLEQKLVRYADVGVLQRQLGVKETGQFDAATRSAIAGRQAEFGFEPTGQVTRMFLKKLGIEDLAAKP